jgi:hypothetical protein
VNKTIVALVLMPCAGILSCKNKASGGTDDMTIVVNLDSQAQQLKDHLQAVTKERDELVAKHSATLQDLLDGSKDRKALRQREDAILSRQQELANHEKQISQDMQRLAQKRSDVMMETIKTANVSASVRQVLDQIKSDLERRERDVAAREAQLIVCGGRSGQSVPAASTAVAAKPVGEKTPGDDQTSVLKQILQRLDALDAAIKRGGSGLDYRGVSYTRGDVKLLVDSLSSQLAERGLLWSDVSGGDEARKKAEDLAQKGQSAKAMQLLADVQDSLGRVTIDTKFLRAKVERLTKVRGKRATISAEEKLFTQFAQEQAKGELNAANLTLNKLYRLSQ